MARPRTWKEKWAATARRVNAFARRLPVPLVVFTTTALGYIANPLNDSQAFGAYKQIAFEVAVGLFVSMVTYGLVVVLPGFSKRRMIRRNLVRQFENFKEDCIGVFVAASGDCLVWDEEKTLLDQREFKRFFDAPTSSSTKRWDDVVNGLEPDQEKRLGRAMTVLASEVEFTLAVIDIRDTAIFEFLKRLKTTLYEMKEVDDEYDERKGWSIFIWEIFAGWSVFDGQSQSDVFAKMIRDI